MADKNPITIQQGSDFADILQWSQPVRVYSAITAITKAAPCIITSPAHGIPDGWPFWVESVRGMAEINRPFPSSDDDELDNDSKDPYFATVLDANRIEINDLNALDFQPYSSNGTIVYAPPVNLVGYTARMQIRKSLADPTVLIELNTTNGRIVLDTTKMQIKRQILAVDTAALTFTTGTYDLELISASGIITRVAYGPVTVSKEVTR